jgi:hypothetical protein
MRKYLIAIPIAFYFVPSLLAQVYYFKSPGSVTVSPNSVLLPVTVVTPTGVTSTNPNSTPVAYNTAFSDQINQVFQNVDRTPVTTGLLRDYGIAFTDVGLYDGVRTASNYIPYSEWQSLYLSLYSFRFNSATQMQHPAAISEAVDNYTQQSNGGADALARMVYLASNPAVHYITGLHYVYQQFKPDAVASNLVSVVNNQIYDVQGRASSPYLTKEAFGFAIREQQISGSSHQFIIRNDLFLTNTGKSIGSLQIDFGDGSGYRIVSLNTTVSVNYITNGVKNVLFKLTYTDNTVMESQGQVSATGINDVSQNPSARYVDNTSPPIIFPRTDFPLPKSYQGQSGGAVVTIAYGNNNGNVIRRPLFVIEGFDPFNSYSYRNFANDRQFNFNTISSGQTLENLLESNDYDLIFIDFANGADYIQRNAYLVENIIQWVNSQKQPYNGVRQQNAVIGFSMGGLIGRYALRDMEVENIPHETRLFCAFDSPHQGANVPLAFQAAASHISSLGVGFGLPGIYINPSSLTAGKLFPEIGQLASVTYTPAAQQMATYRTIYLPGSGFSYDNSTFNSFMSEYRQLGFPTQSRNLVVSNASECGKDQGYAPNAEMLNIDSTFSLSTWQNVLGTVLAPFSIFTSYPQLALLSIPATNMDIKAQFVANALPNQTNQRLYYGRIYVRRKILGLININITLSQQSLNSDPSFLPLDNTEGGVYDIDAWGTINLPFKIKRFNFIPAYSSLDIGGGSQPIIYNDLYTSYSPATPSGPPKNVRANNFITGSAVTRGSTIFANENHTQITRRNGNWLFTELQGTSATSNCLYLCTGVTNVTITGTYNFCINSNATYTINNVPAGTSILWTFSSNVTYVSGQGSTQLVVRGNSGGSGSIGATLTGECGEIQVPQRLIKVGGYSSSDYPVSGPSSACRNTNVYYNTVDLPGATSYTWFWPSGWTYVSGQGTRFLALRTPNSFASGAVGVRVANACDAGGSPGTSFTSLINCGGFSTLAVYPNPTSDVLTLEVMPADNTLEAKAISDDVVIDEIHLYDGQKTEKVSKLKVKKKAEIDVKHLTKGTYYLTVIIGKEKIQKQIVIQ